MKKRLVESSQCGAVACILHDSVPAVPSLHDCARSQRGLATLYAPLEEDLSSARTLECRASKARWMVVVVVQMAGWSACSLRALCGSIQSRPLAAVRARSELYFPPSTSNSAMAAPATGHSWHRDAHPPLLPCYFANSGTVCIGLSIPQHVCTSSKESSLFILHSVADRLQSRHLIAGPSVASLTRE